MKRIAGIPLIILGNIISQIINFFKNRVSADGGVFEAESCLESEVVRLRNLGLWDKASLIITPNAYKAGKIYSIKPGSNGDLTFSRGGSKIRRAISGLFETIGNNVPALDSVVLGSCPVVSLEPQRTNLIINSGLQNGWSFSNPANYTTATLVMSGIDGRSIGVVNTNNGIDYSNGLRQNPFSASIPSGSTFAISFFVRKTGANNTFGYYAVSSGLEVSGVFNVDANTRVANYNAGVTRVNFFIIPLGNGIYRCIDILTATTALTYTTLTLGFATGINTHVAGMSGDFAGIQIEIGSWASSYIATLNSQVTRIADSFSLSNVFTNGLISPSGGTWYIDFRNNSSIVADTTVGIFLGTNSGSGFLGDSLNFRSAGPSGRHKLWKYIGGVGTSLFDTTADTTKIIIKWNGITLDVFANGIKVVTASDFTPTNLQFLAASGIGRPISFSMMLICPFPISDNECIAATI